jgi:Rrf2 family transcriptional regulator, cysteine metabolism repressor
MKLSTRTRYGMRAVLSLAANYGKGPLQTNVIAKQQELSIKYLEQLMAILKASGLVKSIRGAKGGYVLAKKPDEIKLSEVFFCLEGPIVTVECIESPSYCDRYADCTCRQLWSQVQQAITTILQSMTLQDMIDKSKNQKTMNYQI